MRRNTKPPAERESGIQDAAVAVLRLLGYRILVTTTHIKRGTSYASGQDKGIPDLLVSHDAWPEAFWVGVEMKRPGGRLSPAQDELKTAYRIVVAHSVEEAVSAVRTCEYVAFGQVFGRNCSIQPECPPIRMYL